MGFFARRQFRKYVDNYMKNYRELRSQGLSCDDALKTVDEMYYNSRPLSYDERFKLGSKLPYQGISIPHNISEGDKILYAIKKTHQDRYWEVVGELVSDESVKVITEHLLDKYGIPNSQEADTSNEDVELERLGLIPEAFKQAGIYKQLVESIKHLEGDEVARSKAFAEKAMSDELDYDEEIDRLADSQVIIVFGVIKLAGDEDAGVGINARARAILNYCENMDKIVDQLGADSDAKAGIAEIRTILKNYYKKVQAQCRKNDDMMNFDYNDLKALLGDVQFKFTVPIFNIGQDGKKGDGS